MPCGQSVRPKLRHPVQKHLELDVPVAREVGVRRQAGLALGQEPLEHFRPVLRHEVHLHELDTEVPGGRLRVAKVRLCAALTAPLLGVVPVPHENSENVAPRLLQQKGSHRGVNSP